MLNIILAHTSKFGIARKGNIPWKLEEDLKFLKKKKKK